MAAEKVLFDTTKDGRNVSEFVITRPNGESFSVIEYHQKITCDQLPSELAG